METNVKKLFLGVSLAAILAASAGAQPYTPSVNDILKVTSKGSYHDVNALSYIQAMAAGQPNGIPVIAAGFGTAAAVVSTNGTAAFTVNVGTSNTGTGNLTMPAAAHGWACAVNDVTTQSTTVSQTKVSATTTTTVTVQNYGDTMSTHDWVDSDVLQFQCTPY
jgi:hypothetical protein